MDSILDGLNSAQRTAVTSPASILQVLAPPGSGKTKTLTARVAYLLSHHDYRPQDVICCTFTIKASREMRERISKLIGNQLESKLILGTFHSICRRYLLAYGHLIGLKKGFGIADSNDSLAVIKRIIKRLRLGIQANTARFRISSQKAQGIPCEELMVKRSKSSEQEEFVRVYQAYETALSNSNLLDYDDLLLRCADLLQKHPQCVSNVQAVLVDEFQDTNRIQFDLMNLFAARNRRITIVGDPDQSIYGFRSAEIKNLTRMQKLYRDTSVVILENNYRSSSSILSSAEDVIEQDTSRPTKKLHPTHGVGTLPVLRKLPTAAAEAQWLTLEIKRCIALTGNLLKYSDFAVLLRSASLSRQIESEMGKEGIPYRMVGGFRFFDRVEIKILLDYLRAASHPEDSDTIIRVINVPPRKIGEETVKLLTTGAEEAKMSLWVFVKDVAQGRRSTKKGLSKAAERGLGNFLGLVEASKQKLLECRDDTAPRRLLEFIIRRLSFREFLKTAYPLDEENRWANIEELLAQAGDASNPAASPGGDDHLPRIDGLEQQQGHPGHEALTRFLANIALSTEITSDDSSKEKVTISTIHAAKGLEWPVVFVPAVYDGIIPHSRAEDADEERRLLYVAMTRAQALLYLSFPRRDSKNGDDTAQSSFLPPNIVDNRFRATGPKFHEKAVYGIADILRRPRPAIEEMLKGMSGLPSVEDDRWTADGEEHPGAVPKWDSSRALPPTYEYSWAKRRRVDQEDRPKSCTYLASASYTMNNQASFSISNTLSVGFSTARQHMATQESTTSDRASKEEVNGVPNKMTATSHIDSGLTQGTISTFFGQIGAKRTASKSPSLVNRQPVKESQDDEYAQINRFQASRDILQPTVPENLSDHRIQPQRWLPSRPTADPSKPLEYTWLSALPKPEANPPSIASQQKGGNSFENTEIRTEAENDEIKRSQGGLDCIQSAATYHPATMQARPTTGRKTLGIRRGMSGWADRMSKANNKNA
ncbi:P-loop containing nucleoside triphosphate hydrolase protein [Elaphomyces granulatus]